MSPPLRTLRQTCGAPNLIVLLPGAYMTPEDFEKAGFFAAVSQRQLALDIAAVDLDFAAISGGTALPALQAEILEPARQQGYTKKSGWAASRSAACSPSAITPTHRAASTVSA
jgi:hypothetical protein